MTRNIIIVALIGLLAACSTQGDGTTTESSDQAGATAVASASAGASGDASTGPTGDASAACGEAFAALAAEDVTSLSDLADLEGVEATIQQCESVADWMAGAGELIGEEVNPSTAQLLLEIRCELPSLADSAVCEEVASS
jgi:hypothetical protein